MSIFNTFSRRCALCIVYILLAAVFFSGCTEEPSEPEPTSTRTPLPTLAPEPITSNPTPTLDSAALPTPFVTPSPSGPSPTPSATPGVSERLDIGNKALEIGSYESAVEQFSALLRQDAALETEEQADTLLKLGRAYLAEDRQMDAATIFNQLIALQGIDELPAEAHFLLGQAYFGQDEFEAAIEAYTTFLAEEPGMGGYVYPLIAAAYQALGDDAAVIEAYEAGLQEPGFRLKEVETRLLLAGEYLAAGDPASAVTQYDAVYDMAQTKATRGQMTFQAGAAELSAGNVEAAFDRFLQGMEEYPEAYESYLGLVELVKAEVPVDDYQRGLVDYHAAAYAPGIEALQAHIDANPEEYQPDAHLYLAWSYEALSDLESAYTELDAYAVREPADGLLEQARMRARAGDSETAVGLYQQFVEDFPQSEDAPFAAWWLASLTAELDDAAAAIDHYVSLADSYPEHEDAPEALFRAGQLAATAEDLERAYDLWLRSAEEYPSTLYGSAALLDALKVELEIGGGDTELPAAVLAASPAASSYQALRARDLAAGNEPFDSLTQFVVPADETTEREEAASWLVEQFDLDPDLVNEDISEELQQDERLSVGKRLWELGLYEEGKRELEALRQAYAEDPLATYQLALFFRDLGLYRSSIIAATTLLNLAGTHELDAPVLIGRLAYPVYYADLIASLAEQYGFDPRLQFSLVRQESLYESFARSGAVAQGLSQVIPETGAWIAERLEWPDYENDDLYKPYVGLNFGAYYLGEQLEYFDGDVHAALAAYNAGPGNAARWYETAGSDLDLFVDTIDFWETKSYVERIYAGYDIYSHLYEPQ